ncbi:ArsI/CadI family heavy metal resistance metalloenzyme [Vogesella sp. LIG4]|uniref:ArsI/CadI family heavy metal resistance metalloenzyme n=1 Tax=Vogesella sp. LIG4 TaxID=1192162 RepID=UPI00081F9B2F|nr:ArsI/CadI family heavy metal resistance metalloenzyme [Vogesella sp. LIG4]SCK17184.1 Catechol 2,3-dioxygenase [Vogesella sp. LIG4]
MKRMHIHVAVDDLAASIRFYNALFGAEPTVHKPDYAKWMLDDPRVNFAISQRGARPGLDHLGIQTESAEELAELKQRIDAAGLAALSEEGTTCCYAVSDKHWLQDPSGIAWESYHTLDTAPTYNTAPAAVAANPDSCCAPASGAISEAACCAPAPQRVQLIARKNIEATVSRERKSRD